MALYPGFVALYSASILGSPLNHSESPHVAEASELAHGAIRQLNIPAWTA